ncbi:ABC transporter ATP-binding protein [Clostridium sp.]|uniref:ABC transporter ATP-binding protein n=1 Tax=Clostridium sp. TaxID=1506 RepID=UPI002611F368|nr:ABC transporter ATP-binding protein [Clostridium sp.]
MGKLKSLLKLKTLITKHRIPCIIGVIGMLISSIIANPIPYIIGHIMDAILINSKSYNEFYIYIFIIFVLYILRYIISIISKYLFAKVNNSIVNELKYSVIDKVIDLPMSYLSNTEKGYIQSRISECNSVGGIFSPSFIGVFLNIIDAILALISMFALNYKLTIIVLILTPIFFFTTKASSLKLMESTKDTLESSAILNELTSNPYLYFYKLN